MVKREHESNHETALMAQTAAASPPCRPKEGQDGIWLLKKSMVVLECYIGYCSAINMFKILRRAKVRLAFTMVEMGAVIAIGAVLAALLFSAASSFACNGNRADAVQDLRPLGAFDLSRGNLS